MIKIYFFNSYRLQHRNIRTHHRIYKNLYYSQKLLGINKAPAEAFVFFICNKLVDKPIHNNIRKINNSQISKAARKSNIHSECFCFLDHLFETRAKWQKWKNLRAFCTKCFITSFRQKLVNRAVRDQNWQVFFLERNDQIIFCLIIQSLSLLLTAITIVVGLIDIIYVLITKEQFDRPRGHFFNSTAVVVYLFCSLFVHALVCLGNFMQRSILFIPYLILQVSQTNGSRTNPV